MKSITAKEKYAIVNILFQIMKADGSIHPKEEEYMNWVYSKFKITIKDLEEASDIDDFHAKQIIDAMSAESKEYARSIFIGMAESDGNVHPKESTIINQIFK